MSTSITYREPTFGAAKAALASLGTEDLGNLADVLQAAWRAKDEGKAGEAVLAELPSVFAVVKAFPEPMRILAESAVLFDGKPKPAGWLNDAPLSEFVGHVKGLAESGCLTRLLDTAKNLIPPAKEAGATSGN